MMELFAIVVIREKIGVAVCDTSCVRGLLGEIRSRCIVLIINMHIIKVFAIKLVITIGV